MPRLAAKYPTLDRLLKQLIEKDPEFDLMVERGKDGNVIAIYSTAFDKKEFKSAKERIEKKP